MKRADKVIAWRDGGSVTYQTVAQKRSNPWRWVLRGGVVLAQAAGFLFVLYVATVALLVL